MTYHTIVGRRRAKSPAKDIYRIPSESASDDGASIAHVGNEPIVCTDCNRGHLQWAEAGYTPWHRICDSCGSHWDLHPIVWGPTFDPDGSIYRWVDGSGKVEIRPDEQVIQNSTVTWGDLLVRVTRDHITEAKANQALAGMVVIPCAVAIRARFY